MIGDVYRLDEVLARAFNTVRNLELTLKTLCGTYLHTVIQQFSRELKPLDNITKIPIFAHF